jgi:hypothetical protein
MILPDPRAFGVPPAYLLVGVAGLLVGLLAAAMANHGRRDSGGVGIAVWIMIPFLLALGGVALWMVLITFKVMRPDVFSQ